MLVAVVDRLLLLALVVLVVVAMALTIHKLEHQQLQIQAAVVVAARLPTLLIFQALMAAPASS